ncbi:DUF4080 domain-containing protein [bacterium]|nr:DUF4080 domain-containing protein [bacterium]
MAAEIVLATLNARYAHASFGLRCLLANMGELRPRTKLLEFDIHRAPLEVARKILEESPAIVGLGVYIWNVAETTAVVSLLKELRPDLTVVLGGPEVSYETGSQEIVRLADFVIAGEGDLAFARLARSLLAGERPGEKVIAAPLPPLEELASPYGEYTEEDLAHRVIYVEASRGCPYRCEFCLSSLDIPVRAFPLEPFLEEMQRLLDRGARNFKFVDRTFNLAARTSCAILGFFLERPRPGLHVHFELIPDRLPREVRDLAARFPEGSIQFEIGVQTFTPGVNEAVSRFQKTEKVEENLRFLRDETDVHVHADLIFGLPGETLATFGASFDRLIALDPGDIQVGILKRLRGTPIVRHEESGRLVFSKSPPYEVLSTDTVSAGEMQRIRRFSRYFETFRNGGDHARAVALLLAAGPSPFFVRVPRVLRLGVREDRPHVRARLACALRVDLRVPRLRQKAPTGGGRGSDDRRLLRAGPAPRAAPVPGALRRPRRAQGAPEEEPREGPRPASRLTAVAA